MSDPARQPREWSWWYLLLLVQFVAVLWPPFYNKAEPYLDRHSRSSIGISCCG